MNDVLSYCKTHRVPKKREVCETRNCKVNRVCKVFKNWIRLHDNKSLTTVLYKIGVRVT